MVTPVWLLTVPTCITTAALRSEEHTSELRHLVISYAVFCLKKNAHGSQPEACLGGFDSGIQTRRNCALITCGRWAKCQGILTKPITYFLKRCASDAVSPLPRPHALGT